MRNTGSRTALSECYQASKEKGSKKGKGDYMRSL
jgi:hypothetical protein